MTLTGTTAVKKVVVLVAAALALSLAMAAAPSDLPGAPPPAIAEAMTEVDSGALQTGIAEVAKAFHFCRKDADGLVEWERKLGSPGLGLPDPNAEKKNAWWGLTTPVISTMKGVGELQACGFLTAMDVNGEQLGAACGASKGWNGIGTIEWAADPLNPMKDPKVNGITQLEDIGWKVSVGGTLPVTANMVDPKDKSIKIGFLQATVQALGPGCPEKGPGQPDKGDPKTGGEQGANEFVVNGVYEAVRHHGKEENPEQFKKDDSPGTKKDENRPHTKP